MSSSARPIRPSWTTARCRPRSTTTGPSGVTFVRQLARARDPEARFGLGAGRGGRETAGRPERRQRGAGRRNRRRSGRTSRRACATRANAATCSWPGFHGGSRSAFNASRRQVGAHFRWLRRFGIRVARRCWRTTRCSSRRRRAKASGATSTTRSARPGWRSMSDGTLDLARTSGATLYYQRKWTPDWMTVAGASTLWLSDDGLRPSGRAAPDKLCFA